MLSVAVCRLVEIHKVHINIIPRNISVELCIYMKIRLLQNIKTRYPSL